MFKQIFTNAIVRHTASRSRKALEAPYFKENIESLVYTFETIGYCAMNEKQLLVNGQRYDVEEYHIPKAFVELIEMSKLYTTSKSKYRVKPLFTSNIFSSVDVSDESVQLMTPSEVTSFLDYITDGLRQDKKLTIKTVNKDFTTTVSDVNVIQYEGNLLQVGSTYSEVDLVKATMLGDFHTPVSNIGLFYPTIGVTVTELELFDYIIS